MTYAEKKAGYICVSCGGMVEEDRRGLATRCVPCADKRAKTKREREEKRWKYYACTDCGNNSGEDRRCKKCAKKNADNQAAYRERHKQLTGETKQIGQPPYDEGRYKTIDTDRWAIGLQPDGREIIYCTACGWTPGIGAAVPPCCLGRCRG